MSKLREIISGGGGPNLLLNIIQRHLSHAKRTSDAHLVVTRPINRLGHGVYDAVDVTVEGRQFRITVKEVTR